MSPDAKPLLQQRALVIALLATLVLWNLPFGGFVLYPFKLLATWFHEMSHGVVMLTTGAGFDHMEIFRDTSGLAYANRGVTDPARAAIASAGYMGTPMFGALLLVTGQSRRGGRIVLASLGAALFFSALLFISNDFGLVAVFLAAAVFLGTAALAPPRTAVFVVNVIAVQACINAFLDIRVLFRENLVVNGEKVGASDAHNMAAATFGSPTLWAILWLAWSFAAVFVALRFVYLRQHVPAVEIAG